jgi:hypothetical protein
VVDDMTWMPLCRFKLVAASWARSALSGALALYLVGNRSWSDLAMAGLAALAPVILRSLNPDDEIRTVGKPDAPD